MASTGIAVRGIDTGWGDGVAQSRARGTDVAQSWSDAPTRASLRVLAEGAASYPLRRLGTTADVADTIMFLISESAGWISGESVNIDGGNLSG